MRLSRPCYDKPHRCPGWAGGGWRYGKEDLCDGGSIRVGPGVFPPVNVSGEEFWALNMGAYPGTRVFRFGRCTKCDVVTWPYAIRWLDPTAIKTNIMLLRNNITWRF